MGVHEGMNCHSLSEPILFLIRDVPYTTVGKQGRAGRPTNIYSGIEEGTWTATPAVCRSLQSLPEGVQRMMDGKRKEEGVRVLSFPWDS